MTDLINPRLFERVERSLRKRLGTQVKPHLTRCAARAQNEDEFMAAAARMLLDPQERRQWLASWALRRHQESRDTTPAELDTAPGALAPSPFTGPTPLDAPLQRSYRITVHQRERLREALADALGPIADLLLDHEEQSAETVSDLLQRLESHLDSEEQRSRFRLATLSSRPSA